MKAQDLFRAATSATAAASRGPTAKALLEREVISALDKAEAGAQRLPLVPRSGAQAALKALRERLPEIVDLGREGLILVAARASVAMSAEPQRHAETLDDALTASCAQTEALAHERDLELRMWSLAADVARAAGEAGARVALPLLLGVL